MFAKPEHWDIREFLERVNGHEVRELKLHFRQLRGGLVAELVTRVAAKYRCGEGIHRSAAFVMKQMDEFGSREAHVYSILSGIDGGRFAPRLLGVHESSGRQFLCLEALEPASSWPWRDLARTREVVELLARLHAQSSLIQHTAVCAWDYDAYLKESSAMTLDSIERLPRKHAPYAPLLKCLPALRRVTDALPEIRNALLEWPGFGCTVIHGDVHPGNVFLHRSTGGESAKLLDWARARLGSPLEDLNSWLQSLGYWEPEARKRHDTLMTAYLAARGLPARITAEVRVGYWLAGASNALAGALWCHLQSLSGEGQRSEMAIRSARDWLRIIRRADDYWRAGGAGRITRVRDPLTSG